MNQDLSRVRLGAKASIRQALMEGSPYPMLTVSDANEADAVLSILRDASARNRWLFSLLTSNPHRLLRALGIAFEGAAQQQFAQTRQKLGWVDRPDEFERIVSSGAVSQGAVRPVILGNGSTGSASQPTDPSERWALSTAIGRVQALTQSILSPAPLPTTPDSQPSIPATEEGYSHAANVDYGGVMLPWDAVIQLHESCLRRQYDVLFASQVIPAGFNPGSPDVIEHGFDFESWLLVFIRVHLRIQVSGDDRRFVTMDGAGQDEVGVYLPFTATTYTRWTPDDEWGEWETFTGTITRFGPVVKKWPIELAGQTFRRTWAANLEKGWNVIELDEGPDETRDMLIEAAANAYIAAELPLLPVTPTFSVKEPLLTYPNSAAFTTALEPDRKAVSLCFHEDAQTLSDTFPFRYYILDHGRNMAVGISIAALQDEVLAGMTLPISEGGVTVESVTLSGGVGRLHLRSEGTATLGVHFSHTADVLLSLDDGQLTAEIDNSTLNLPWWLWVLNTLLFVPLFGVYGLIPLAITNVIGSKIIGGQLEELIDLSSLQEAVSGSFDEGSFVTTSIERVEVNPFGVFLKGNVEIDFS